MNPYLAPESAIPIPPIVRRRPTKTALVGAWLQLSPLIGFVANTIAVNRAVASLGEWREAGIRDPDTIARAMRLAVTGMTIGICGGLLGSVLLSVAVFGQKCRVTWIVVLFWFSLVHVLFVLLRAVSVCLNQTGGQS